MILRAVMYTSLFGIWATTTVGLSQDVPPRIARLQEYRDLLKAEHKSELAVVGLLIKHARTRDEFDRLQEHIKSFINRCEAYVAVADSVIDEVDSPYVDDVKVWKKDMMKLAQVWDAKPWLAVTIGRPADLPRSGNLPPANSAAMLDTVKEMLYGSTAKKKIGLEALFLRRSRKLDGTKDLFERAHYAKASESFAQYVTLFIEQAQATRKNMLANGQRTTAIDLAIKKLKTQETKWRNLAKRARGQSTKPLQPVDLDG